VYLDLFIVGMTHKPL